MDQLPNDVPILSSYWSYQLSLFQLYAQGEEKTVDWVTNPFSIRSLRGRTDRGNLIGKGEIASVPSQRQFPNRNLCEKILKILLTFHLENNICERMGVLKGGMT